jgi:hypothetical protein
VRLSAAQAPATAETSPLVHGLTTGTISSGWSVWAAAAPSDSSKSGITSASVSDADGSSSRKLSVLTETHHDGRTAPGGGPGGEHTALTPDRILSRSGLPAGLIDGETADHILPVTALESHLDGQIPALYLLRKRRSDRPII